MPKAPKSQTTRIHPNSRTAAHMVRQRKHIQKVDRRHAEKASKLGDLGDKLLWFQENTDPDKVVYSKTEARELVQKFMCRFEEELEQIGIKHSIGNHRSQQHAPRKQAIEFIQKEELEKYDGPGFEIPDILCAKNLKTLHEWTRELRYVPNIKLTKLKSEKADPPKLPKKDKKSEENQNTSKETSEATEPEESKAEKDISKETTNVVQSDTSKDCSDSEKGSAAAADAKMDMD